MSQPLQKSQLGLSRHLVAARWFTAEVMPATLATWQRNPSEFSRTVKARSVLGELDLGQAIQEGYHSACDADGRRIVWLFPKVGRQYDLLELYHRSKKAAAAARPHGWFWHLPDEHLGFAARFLHHFGPLGRLTLQPDGLDECAPVDLGDFWSKQNRFRVITTLWINLENIVTLRQSWMELHSRLTQIDAADEFPLGSIPNPTTIDYRACLAPGELADTGNVELELPVLLELRKLPPDSDRVKSWLETQDDSVLIRDAIELVTGELHAHLRHLAHWRPSIHGTRPRFELTLIPDSLWSALWYLFALDTQAGVGWRICPNHKKLFYPPRKDRFFCKTQEQGAHARLDWWNRNKERELQKRRASRRGKGAIKK